MRRVSFYDVTVSVPYCGTLLRPTYRLTGANFGFASNIVCVSGCSRTANSEAKNGSPTNRPPWLRTNPNVATDQSSAQKQEARCQSSPHAAALLESEHHQTLEGSPSTRTPSYQATRATCRRSFAGTAISTTNGVALNAFATGL
jgi:hypothetical protein